MPWHGTSALAAITAMAFSLAAMAAPRTVVRVAPSIVEKEVSRALAGRGFVLMDDKGAPSKAELLVVGQTSTTSGGSIRNLAGVESMTGTTSRILLKAVRPETGEILWSDQESGTDLVRTATTVAARFAGDVLTQWQREVENQGEHPLEVAIVSAQGKLSIADLKEFKETLFIAVDGVVEITQKSRDAKQTVLRVLYTKTPQSFREAIDHKRLGEHVMRVSEMQGNKLTVIFE
jgi:hypothetical protein